MNQTTVYVVLIILVVLGIVYFALTRLPGESVEYYESDDGGETDVPEDVRYRADWLTVLMNYLIMGFTEDEEPSISAYRPADGVSCLRIAFKTTYFEIEVHWLKQKLIFTGNYMGVLSNGQMLTLAKKSVRWKGYAIPYAAVDSFLDKYFAAQDKLLTNAWDDNKADLAANDNIEDMVATILLTLNKEDLEGWNGDEAPLDLMRHFVQYIYKLPSAKINPYIDDLARLAAYFVNKFEGNWVQNLEPKNLSSDDVLSHIEEVLKGEPDEADEEEKYEEE